MRKNTKYYSLVDEIKMNATGNNMLCTASTVVDGSGVGVRISYRDGNTGEECKVLSPPLSAHNHTTNKVHCTSYL